MPYLQGNLDLELFERMRICENKGDGSKHPQLLDSGTERP